MSIGGVRLHLHAGLNHAEISGHPIIDGRDPLLQRRSPVVRHGHAPAAGNLRAPGAHIGDGRVEAAAGPRAELSQGYLQELSLQQEGR